jgi:DNA invertase Pin-like site-specific DNA recombinase
MLYGYARCSTDENKQDITRQVRELKQKGVSEAEIFLEYQSGMKTDRLQLARLLERVKPMDTIVSTEVSRITRSTQQLCEIVERAKRDKLCLMFGSFVVDCRNELDPMTEGMLKMMGVFSELERNIISQRVKSGMANAREKGTQIGRKKLTLENLPQEFLRHYPLFASGTINKAELSRLCKCSYPTIIKYIELCK